MSLDPLSIISGIIDLLIIALKISIPAFLIGLIVVFFKNWLAKKYGLSWIQSAVVATYLAVTIILFFLYLFPYYLGFLASDLAKQAAPSMLSLTVWDIAAAVFFTIIKILGSALILTIMLLPLEFLAEFFSSKLKEKKIPELAKKFAVAYFTSLVVTIIILFIFPWMLTGIIYMIYWG